LSRLQIVNAKKMEKLLFLIGFVKVRQKGGHVFYRHPDGRFTTLTHHRGRVLSRPLIREVLKEIEITIDDYNQFLKEL